MKTRNDAKLLFHHQDSQPLDWASRCRQKRTIHLNYSILPHQSLI